jgi:hypothetical protein
LYSKQSENSLRTYLLDKTSGTTNELVIPFIPFKCAFTKENAFVYCGDSNEAADAEFPDNWLRGETSYADDIWVTNTVTLESSLLSSTLEESGRELDIVAPQLSETEANLYFSNKNDHTLWVYDLEGIATTTQQ